MHEYSLVRSLLKQVQQIASDHDADCVREISVSIGPLSGVEPMLVTSAFEQLRSSFAMQTASLRVSESKLLARCSGCEASFEVLGFVFECPECGSRRVQITEGEEFRLLDLTVDETDPARLQEMETE